MKFDWNEMAFAEKKNYSLINNSDDISKLNLIAYNF